MRYPRGCGPGTDIPATLEPLPVGQGLVRRTTGRQDKRIAFLSFGATVNAALAAGESYNFV